ncbi:MAG: tetraacyldisaccharide 4'-kinase [Bacteroidales bacterium]|nr:tetraacyldisaccharide 4'-kinase [Bacteroidales bacterium]
MKLVKILLAPLAVLYGTGAWLRNVLFDSGVLPQKTFGLPVISVGNLNMGGTGKTPHVNYIVRLLKDEKKTAVVSRGYKRKSRGFVLASENSTVVDIGDEPLQYKKRFPGISVAVCEKRAEGIAALLVERPETEAVILDDAYQHRHVKPGLSVLLTCYNDLYVNDCLIPAGRLREFRCGAKRADIIVVTKAPLELTDEERVKIAGQIRPRRRQSLFFSSFEYRGLEPVPGSGFQPAGTHYDSILMVTGIAHPQPMKKHLESHCNHLIHIPFRDHHRFTPDDLNRIEAGFLALPAGQNAVITTEKDAMRFMAPELSDLIRRLPLAYVPVEVKFNIDDEEKFNNKITDYVGKNQRNG